MPPQLDEMMSSAVLNPVTEVLRGIRLNKSFYCESDLSAPWGYAIPPQPAVLFHFVVAGTCWLGLEGQPAIALREGDLVLLPHGRGNSLSDTPDRPTVPVYELPHDKHGENASLLIYGGGGEATRLICGGVGMEPVWHPLLEVLPEQIVISNGAGAAPRPWISPLLQLLNGEAGAMRPGGETIITRLCDVMIMKAVREWMEESSSTNGWLVALRDPQLGQAIAGIHGRPEYPWTVADLAGRSGMSRSVFTEKFTLLCGLPPLQYVTRLRMNLAGDWLQQTQLSAGEVADKLGYSSDATFSRAFKRYWGIAPGKFRQSPPPDRASYRPSRSLVGSTSVT